ncbi:MAG TPA: AraC family transcriptional regulator [Flavobacteriaceae bacterium]|nr:AraC family transcriptional regulator [Flavobacteriaceae bacterium]
MVKKRRDFANCEFVELMGNATDLSQLIAIQTSYSDEEGVRYSKNHILPKYGSGCIINFQFSEIKLSISRFKLNRDLIVNYDCDADFTQLSFLLEGEKIISLNTNTNQILLENQESYMANLNQLKGSVRISSKKNFKEIKIRLSKLFLLKYSFPSDYNFKKISEKNLILPITNELFKILTNLEESSLKGLSRKIFMESKVLELLAIQIENYTNDELKKKNAEGSKTIKKIYKIQQILKDNLNQNYSIRFLSKKIGLNETVLKQEFIRLFGCSMSEYSKNEKMSKAKELLRCTQIPIYQIAEEIGYKNATHFSVAFKKYVGKLPKQYRNFLN